MIYFIGFYAFVGLVVGFFTYIGFMNCGRDKIIFLSLVAGVLVGAFWPFITAGTYICVLQVRREKIE